MQRITKADLENVVTRINEMAKAPLQPWTNAGKGMKANIGNYHLDWAYGGVSLHKMVSDGGAVESIIAGYLTKRELFYHMQAFISGMRA